MPEDTPLPAPVLYEVDAAPAGAAPRAPSAAPARAITAYAFRARFTLAERVALDLASIAQPGHDAAQALQAAMVRVMLQDMASAAWVDLDAPSVAQGMEMLVQASLLEPVRRDAILRLPVQPEERPVR